MIEGQEGVTWEQWLALALATEAAGLDGLFRSDHYRSIVRGEPAGSLDAWATLAALAARTERIRLGTMVSPVTFRPASVLAKNVVTVDHVSGGRVELGIGAGLVRGRARALRVPVRHAARAARRARSPARRDHAPVDGGRGRPAAARSSSRARRSSSAGARSRGRSPPRSAIADEYNTTFPSVEEARERGDRRGRGRAGRRPCAARFSMMTGCVVGRDAAEVRERLRRGGTSRGARTSRRSAGRSTRCLAPARLRGRGRRAGDAPAPRPRGRRDGRDPRRGRRAGRHIGCCDRPPRAAAWGTPWSPAWSTTSSTSAAWGSSTSGRSAAATSGKHARQLDAVGRRPPLRAG